MTRFNKGLRSSNTPEWSTPQEIVDDFGPFDLDPCATPENAKAPRFFTAEDDGLAQEWSGRVWMNPPYGRAIGDWMRKAALAGCPVTALVPARTDTRWWHDWVMDCADSVLLVRGRVRFGGTIYSPFPSAVVLFDERPGSPSLEAYVQPRLRAEVAL